MYRSLSIAAGTLLLISQAVAEHAVMEEMLVVASHDKRQIDVADTVAITPDSASLLRKAPGANVNGNGPLTGIPQYRGMYGNRISVDVNGASLSSGGPNWMDPPLSYAPTAQLESLEVYRGIAPVSAGQETIGGAISAKTWEGDFASGEDIETSGVIRAGGQSVNSGSLLSAAVAVANAHHRVKVAALTEQADDAEFSGGDIVPTEYERQRYDLAYGFQLNGHTLQLDVGRNETSDSGTPALPMDIQYIDTDLYSARYGYQDDSWRMDAKVYGSDIDHGMSNYDLREPPAMAGLWRRNVASGDNLGFAVSGEWESSQGMWKAGIDGHGESHDSDIDNPNNAAFFVVNFNDAEREVLGVFLERKHQLGNHWLAELGLRYNRVEMDADTVNGTPAMMPPGGTLRDDFNSADRTKNDDNIDWVAKFYYANSKATTWYLGAARKSRSASYQERYLWLPLEATGGLADGRTYTGNINLDSEVAHQIEFGVDFDQAGFSMSPRVFYQYVNDYIQGTQSTNTAAIMFVAMMNAMNGTNNPPPLEFNNVDAILYGFDMDWRYNFDSQWSLGGVINYVRGERDDTNDNLYRIAPLNGTVAVNYGASSWGVSLEGVVYDEQNKVSKTNSEQKSDGYGLVNLNGYWHLARNTRLGFGVDNIADKKYRDHLGGYNRVRGNKDIEVGERLPGYGRSLFARVDYQW